VGDGPSDQRALRPSDTEGRLSFRFGGGCVVVDVLCHANEQVVVGRSSLDSQSAVNSLGVVCVSGRC
jgi:hypothetical protein